MPRIKQQTQESEDFQDNQSEGEKIEIRKPKIQRLDKFKNLKKIIINVSMTQYPVVTDVAEELNWKVQSSNQNGEWDVYWTDFAIDPDILIRMHLFQKINHYPGIHVIARKNLLGMGLMTLRNKFPDEYNFFPLTWMLPSQYAQFRDYYDNRPKGKCRTYIVKPEAQCQGRGIFLTRKIQDMENGKHYVVQRYLARPYLIDGLKFDFRIYVLLCGTDPLRLYIYNEGLARLATEKYIEPCSANLHQVYIHLTNYAINKNNPKFIFNTSANNMSVGHKRSLSSVYKQLAAKGVDVETLKKQINDIAIKTIITGLPLMSHQYKCSQPQDYSGNMCFHILGLDIMLDNKAQPVLIQVNHTPSFSTDTPLDYLIKKNLIKDTLVLMNINTKKKSELFNKCKDYNQERLLTGKRHIYEGEDRQKKLYQAEQERDKYQSSHLGGYQKIYPTNDENVNLKYQNIIATATKSYFQQNGSIRLKLQEKQGRRLMRMERKRLYQESNTAPQVGEKSDNIGQQKKQNMEDIVYKGDKEDKEEEQQENEQNQVKEYKMKKQKRQESDKKQKKFKQFRERQQKYLKMKKYKSDNQEVKMQKKTENDQIKEQKLNIQQNKTDKPRSERKLNSNNQKSPDLTRSQNCAIMENQLVRSQINRNQKIINHLKGSEITVISEIRSRIQLKQSSAQMGRNKPQFPQIQQQTLHNPSIIELFNRSQLINKTILNKRREKQKMNNSDKKNYNDKYNNSEPKSKRLFQNMTKQMKDMVEKKNGGYVMPKIFLMNVEMEKKQINFLSIKKIQSANENLE